MTCRAPPIGRLELGLLVLALGGGPACSPDPSPPAPAPTRPDLVVLTIDTLRRDHVGAYASELPAALETPAFDALAQRGLVHTAAFTPMPTTGPAHVSLFTGLPPRQHGSLRNGVPMRAEAAAHEAGVRLREEAGYATAAFVTHRVTSREWTGLRGFEVHDAPDPGRQRPAPEAVDAALAWLGRQVGRPVLLWLHFYDPHVPYGSPAQKQAAPRVDLSAHGFIEDDRYASAEARAAVEARYGAGVGTTDDALGRLITGVEQVRGRRPLWILAADHGESFAERLESRGFAYDHGKFLDPEVVRIPLIVAGPGVEPGRSAGAVSLRDVQATILAAAGLAPVSAGQRDLRQPSDAHRVVTIRRRRFRSEIDQRVRAHAVAATDGSARVVLGEDGQPSEQEGDVRALLPLARRVLDAATEPGARLDPATRKALREIGYVE